MGSGYEYTCDNCGRHISTSGPWEFYRNDEGKIKSYGHPGPWSEEAKNHDIAGLMGSLYCIQCDRVFHNVVMVEFKTPSLDSLSVWWGRNEPQDIYKDKGSVKCPKCGNTSLILEIEDEIVCPRCKKGKLIGGCQWDS